MFSYLRGRDLVLLGEGLEFLALDVPPPLAGKSLVEAGVRARTGLNVVALPSEETTLPGPPPDHPLPLGGRLLAVGTREQRMRFARAYGS